MPVPIDRDGTVYVVDSWYNKLLYQGPARQGEEVVVDPDADQVTVGGQVVVGGKDIRHTGSSKHVSSPPPAKPSES